MTTNLREALGYSDEEVLALLIVLKDRIKWMKKNRPILFADIIAYTGVREDELLAAQHTRYTRYLANEVIGPLMEGEEKSKPIQLIILLAERSGPSEAEQKETMVRIIEQVNQKFILPKAGEKTL